MTQSQFQKGWIRGRDDAPDVGFDNNAEAEIDSNISSSRAV